MSAVIPRSAQPLRGCLAGPALLAFVAVRNGIVEAVGPSEGVGVPEGAAVVEGRGRYLMPGLVDAQVHMSPAEAPVYVSRGITAVGD